MSTCAEHRVNLRSSTVLHTTRQRHAAFLVPDVPCSEVPPDLRPLTAPRHVAARTRQRHSTARPTARVRDAWFPRRGVVGTQTYFFLPDGALDAGEACSVDLEAGGA